MAKRNSAKSSKKLSKRKVFSHRANLIGAIASLFLLSLGMFVVPDPAIALPPAIGKFTTDQLFASGGGGCGMTLWRPTDASRDRYIFFNGLDATHRFGKPFDRGSMFMVIDGQMTKFSRVKALGQDFYGQKTAQTFQSFDRKILVEVEVTLGKLGEIESVAIDKGLIRIKKIGEVAIEIPVIGDAGC